ncbi:MAG: FecR domain-containing protein [Planctomycetes bacterium]|nr:FecR domain-containing protein [Planctomycetota bacterium]
MTDPVKLIHLYMDERLSPEQAEELRSRLLKDVEFARLFARYGLLNSCIRNEFLEEDLKESIERFVVPTSADGRINTDFSDTGQMAAETIMKPEEPESSHVSQIKAQAERQLQAFLAEQAEMNKTQPSLPSPSFDLYEFSQGCVKKLELATKQVATLGVRAAICGVFALVVWGGIHYWHTHRVVATLGDSSHAVWRVPQEDLQLRRGSMTLEQGYAQLIFRQGADVLLQAPCTFDLQSANKMALENGSLTANVPPQAVGFTVKTPWTTVVDYGTEFGLSTGQTNGAEVHVFKGSVGVGDANAPQLTEKGEAAHVDQTGHIEVGSLDDRPNLFVRHMPEVGSCFGIPGRRLDLADVVGGGNGFGTGASGRAWNPSAANTRITHRAAILRSPLNNRGYRVGSGFVGIEAFPFIDGILVPDGGEQSPTISSTGLLFQDCPDTHGTHYDGIVCGAVFDDQKVHTGRLAGHRYETPEHPSIGACANVGITFDLDSIRASMPGSLITRFQAHCGISETLADIHQNEEDVYRQVEVTFWVLVDGRIEYSRQLGTDPFESDQIDIAITPSDRFLTLITTTPQENLYCWSMFAEPALKLEREQP